MDEFTKIVSRAFVPFIGHHQGLLAFVLRSTAFRVFFFLYCCYFVFLEDFSDTSACQYRGELQDHVF